MSSRVVAPSGSPQAPESVAKPAKADASVEQTDAVEAVAADSKKEEVKVAKKPAVNLFSMWGAKPAAKKREAEPTEEDGDAKKKAKKPLSSLEKALLADEKKKQQGKALSPLELEIKRDEEKAARAAAKEAKEADKEAKVAEKAAKKADTDLQKAEATKAKEDEKSAKETAKGKKKSAAAMEKSKASETKDKTAKLKRTLCKSPEAWYKSGPEAKAKWSEFKASKDFDKSNKKESSYLVFISKLWVQLDDEAIKGKYKEMSEEKEAQFKTEVVVIDPDYYLVKRKKPTSAYFAYTADVRAEVTEQVKKELEEAKSSTDGAAAGEKTPALMGLVAKAIGAKWAALSAEVKAPYEKKAAELKKAYDEGGEKADEDKEAADDAGEEAEEEEEEEEEPAAVEEEAVDMEE